MADNERASIRKRAGLTQLKLAKLADISQSRISSWENGDRELTRGEVEKIAKAIGNHLQQGPQFGCVDDLVQALTVANLHSVQSTGAL